MYFCPRCHHDLLAKTGTSGVSWQCAACGGQAMGFGVLRKSVGEKRMAQISGEMHRQGNNREGCTCPMCSLPMAAITVPVNQQSMKLDACPACRFIWFDAMEFEALPAAPPPPHVLGEIDTSKMSREMREKFAMIQAQEIADQAQTIDPLPDQEWKSIPALMGLPVEMDSPEGGRTPWATYGLSLIIVGVSVVAFTNLEKIVELYGLIPDRAWRDHGLTLATSFFLHANYFHLLGNLYFLLVFGGAVEKDLGPWRWLLLIFVAALTGDLLHIWGDPRGDLPCIGASGGISGLLAYYALMFPQVRLGIIFRFAYVYRRWIQFPAWVAFFLWMLLQMIGAYQQHYGMTAVSSLAHLGGVAAGVGFWFLWRHQTDSLRSPAPRSV